MPSVSDPLAAASSEHQDGSSASAAAGPDSDIQSTRIMLTTAAHFVQQHLEDQLAELGLSPLGLTVLSGIEELAHPSPEDIAAQCLLPTETVNVTLLELADTGLVAASGGGYTLTESGEASLADAHRLEETMLAEKSTTLRLELSALIDRLRESGALPK